jgi:hypothetical protein
MGHMERLSIHGEISANSGAAMAVAKDVYAALPTDGLPMTFVVDSRVCLRQSQRQSAFLEGWAWKVLPSHATHILSFLFIALAKHFFPYVYFSAFADLSADCMPSIRCF